jgi:toxin secretion/phage lysis holin
MKMRECFLIAAGIIGGGITAALGGWDYALQTMVTFMVIDYVTGFIVAGVFKKSRKSESGAIESRVGYKGIVKKCMMLLMVLMGYQLDNVVGMEFARYGVIFAFIINESVSILENAGLMGVPIPNALKQAIGILKKKGDDENGNKS